TGLLIVDANGAFFVEGHGSSSLSGLLSKHAWRCGHRRRRGARFQYPASDRIHDLRPPRSLLCLDGNRALQVGVGRLADLAHAAHANLGGDIVRAEARAWSGVQSSVIIWRDGGTKRIPPALR